MDASIRRSGTGSPVISRRLLLAGGAGLGAAGLLSGCGGGEDAGAASSSITVADWTNGNTAVPDVAAEYTKKTGVKVNFDAPVSFDDYHAKFRTMVASQNPPDVVRTGDDSVAQWAAGGMVLNLNDQIKQQNFDPSTITEDLYNFTVQPDGAQSAFAIGIQPRLFFYNKTMFQEKGIPLPPTTWTDDGWKWADFLAAAQKLTDHDKGVWGCMILNDTGCEQTFSYNNGGEGTFSKDAKSFTLADDEGIEAIQWLADLSVKHKVQPSWGAMQQDNAGESLFVSQKLGMYFATAGNVPYFQENVDGFEWDICPVPGQVRQTQAGSMTCYTIPSRAKDPEAAFKFLAYLVSDDAGAIYVKENAFVPSNKKAAAEVKATPGKAPAHFDLLPAAVAANRARNPTTVTASAGAVYHPLLDQVYTGEKTAREVLTSVRSKVEQILQDGS